MSTSNSGIKNDEVLLVVASSTALAAAGLDVRLIDAVPCPPPSPSGDASADAASPRIMIGRLRMAKVESVAEVRLQQIGVSEVLKAVARLSKEEIAAIVELLRPSVDDQDHDRFKHEYGVLTIEEMAGRMKCTPEVVREREVAGDLFAAHTPGRAGGELYPKFQLDEHVDKSLLKQIIRKRPTNTVLTQMLNRQQLLGAVYFINEMVVFIGSLDGGIQALEQIVQRLTGLAHQHCQAVVFVGCCGHAFKWRHGSNRNFPTPFNQRLEIDLPGLWLSPLPAFSGHVHAAFCSGARAAAISCARFHGSNSSTRLTG